MTTLAFELIGRDRLSIVLDRAGDSADRMRRRIVIDAAESDAALRRMSTSGDRSATGLRGALGRIGGAVTPGVRSLKMLGAAAELPQVASLASSLANLLPAAGVAATGLIAAGSAAAVLKIGMTGVGDAITAAFTPGTKAKDLEKALDQLSPRARAFVLALHGIKPELDGLKKSVQDGLFYGLDRSIKQVASATLPALREGLGTTAASLNLMARNAAGAVTQLGKTGTLRSVLSGVGDDLADLARIPGQLITGLVQIGSAAEPSFAKLTQGIGSVADTVSGKLTAAFKSGSLKSTIEGAVSQVKQLFGALVNIGKTVGNIFGPAAAAGSGFIPILSSIAATAAKITATPAAQQTFTELFTTLASIGKLVNSVLGAALRAVMPLLSTLVTTLSGPIQSLVATLTPVLTGLVGTLGGALQPVVAAVALGLAQIAPVVGVLVSALAGALTPVLGVLSQILVMLVPPLATIISQVGTALAPVLTQLGQIVVQVGTALLSLLSPVLAQLPSLIGPLVTIAGTLTTTLGGIAVQLLTALQPAFTTIGTALGQVAVALGPVLDQFATLAGQVLTQLTPLLTPLIGLIGQLAGILAGELAKQIQTIVVPALTTISDLLSGNFSGALSNAKVTVKGVAGYIVDVFVRLPAQVFTALGQFGAKVGLRAYEAASQLQGKINEGISTAITWISQLPGKAVSALGALGGKLFSAGSQLIGGFIDGIVSQFDSVKSTLGNLTDQLTSWKGPPKRDATLLTPAGRLLIRGLIKGITATTPELRSSLAKTTRDISSWVHGRMSKALSTGDASSIQTAYKTSLGLITDQGKQLQSVVNKDTSKLESLAKQRKSTLGRISQLREEKKHAKSKSARGRISDEIAAENKKLRDLGKDRSAILREMGTAKAAAKANAALAARLASDNKRLTGLTSQRDAIAAKITQAKEAAASFGDTVRQSASLSSLGEVSSSGDLKAQLQAKLARIRQFASYVQTLAKRGLNKSLLQQVLQMGPEQGLSYASALAGADKSTFAQINAIQATVDKTSTNIGMYGADALYDAGANAGKGFLTGLASQQKAIEAQMVTIAKGMEKAIKKALGIKSPSRVMAPIGRFSTDGLIGGLLSRLPQLHAAVGKVAGAVSSVSPEFAQPQVTAGRTLAARTAAPAPVEIHVHGSIDPVATAREIRKVLLGLKRQLGDINLGLGGAL
jgi:phage-related protein